MEPYAINVINSITVNPDTNQYIQKMKKYISDPDAFHGHMNSFAASWQHNLSKTTVNFIREYNDAYQVWSKEQTLLQMATRFDAEQISNLFNDFNVSPNVDSILRGISKTGISRRKGPSKKKSK